MRSDTGMARAWIARHPVWTFYALAYLYSWSIAVPLAAQALGLTSTHLPWALHYLTAFGPAIAAMMVARLLRTSDAERRTASISVERPRVLAWSIVGLASPLVLFEAARLSVRLAGEAAPSWPSLGAVNFLPDLGLGAWVMWLVTSGIGEELGWRGFALPRLQRTHSALAERAEAAAA